MKPGWPVALGGLILGCGGLLGSSAASADTWAQKCNDAKHVCIDIAVSSVDPKITLMEPAVLKIPPTKFVWKLPEGYVFCYQHNGSSLGGISVQDNGEVSEKGCVDDDENDTQVISKRFKLKAKKLLHDSYKYSVIFDEMNGGKPTRRFTCDPRIANSDTTPGRKSKPKPGSYPESKAVKPDSVLTTFPCSVAPSP